MTKITFKQAELPVRAKLILSPALLHFLAAIAIWSLVIGSFSPFATVYFAQHLHMSLPQIGNAFSSAQIVQVAAVLILPMLFKRLGLVCGIVSTQLVAALLLLVLAVIGHHSLRPLPMSDSPHSNG